MEKLEFIETSCPEVYATSAQVFFDGCVIRIDWRVGRPDPVRAEKDVQVVSVARIAISPALAQAVTLELRALLDQLAGSAAQLQLAPQTTQ